MTPERKEEIRRTAYHEAGHAVVARALKKGIVRVFISRAKRRPLGTEGYCRLRVRCNEWLKATHTRMSYQKRETIISFSGSKAVRLIRDLTDDDGFQDHDPILEAIRWLDLSGPSMEKFLLECAIKSEELVIKHAASIHAVAAVLLEKGRMKGRDVDTIMKENTK